MSIFKYIKERWLIYLCLILSATFSVTVYKLDNRFTVTHSNASYIGMGLILIWAVFAIIDYSVMNYRLKCMKRFCSLNASAEEDVDIFSYPMDKAYAKNFLASVQNFEKFKGEIQNQSSDELEFITKWIHDVKIPIASLRLIVESDENNLSKGFFERIDKEIANIEQSTQTVFFHIKSNTFHNDYKVAEADTKKLISEALKKYAGFFSYKKINISISDAHFKVLTDEKWTGYIISQIVSNAVKYTPEKGAISITTYKKDKFIRIEIKNTGKGISPKDLGQIFNKGYTSSEERKGIKSTGYGLYLSKKLCDMMGHQLTVHSVHGEYAQFDLTFIEEDNIYDVTKM